MEVFLIFPKSQQTNQELAQELAKFQSEQVLKSVQKLSCSTEQKQMCIRDRLFIFCEKEAQRVRAGEDDRQTAGREHVREQRRPLDEILHQRHFIEEHIPETLCFQHLEVTVHIGQCVSGCNLNEDCFRKLCIAHPCKDLTDHGCFSRPAQAVEDEHLVPVSYTHLDVYKRQAGTGKPKT